MSLFPPLRLISAFIISLSVICARADNWIYHLPFGGVDNIAETAGRVYFSSLGALYAYDKKHGETITLSPIDYLNDVAVSSIHAHPNSDAVAVAYSSGNIDIIRDNASILNLPDIKASRLTPRTINSIAFLPDMSAIYVATGFGIVIYDLHRGEVSDYVRFGHPVSDIALIGDTPVIVMQENLYILRHGNPASRPESWQKISTPPILDLISSGKNLFLTVSSGDKSLPAVCNIDTASLSAKVTVMSSSGVIGATPLPSEEVAFLTSSQLQCYDAGGIVRNTATIPSAHPLCVSAVSGLSGVWIGKSDGIVCYDFTTSPPSLVVDRIRPSEMSVSDVNMLRLSPSGSLYIGNRGNSNVHINRTTGNLSRLCRLMPDGKFRDLTPSGLSSFFEKQPNPQGDLLDLTFVREDPDDPELHYIGSLLEGMYAMEKSDEINHFYLDNTCFLDNWGVRVMDLAFDPRGGLWAYSEAPAGTPMIFFLPPEARDRIASVSRNDWTPVGFTAGVSSGRDCTAIVSHDGRYIYSMGSADIYIYDTAGTTSLDDDSGHWAQSFTTNDASEIQVGRVCSLLEDRSDGSLWIGTDAGILVAPRPWETDNGAIHVMRPKVSRNDNTLLADYLLATEKIYGIASDPAGNKWIATEASGAFLVSPDGSRILLNFTSSNSPLPSDEVRAVACNPDGTVFFGTRHGLLEYRSDIRPGTDNLSDISIYPNPVRPDYLGDVIIDGLPDATIVNIVDSGGSLVARLKSEGGRIRWNPRSVSIPSGICHVLASSPVSSGRPIGKIVIIR